MNFNVSKSEQEIIIVAEVHPEKLFVIAAFQFCKFRIDIVKDF